MKAGRGREKVLSLPGCKGRVQNMKLSQLMKGLDVIDTNGELEIEGITCDSRRVKPGWAFVCIEGTAADGHDFAEKAAQDGAALVVAQRDLGLDCQRWCLPPAAPGARMSANWFGNPADKLHLVGITGNQWQNLHHVYAQGDYGGRL